MTAHHHRHRPDSVLVLGGTSEIGLAIAERLVERGARRIVLAGRDTAALAAAGQGLARPGVTVETGDFDADAVDEHEETVSALMEHHGEIDVVVAAWGVLGDQAEAEADSRAAAAIARTNYLDAVSALTVVANRLREQGRGSLVVLSSVAAERTRRSNYVYGSSKAGLDAFSQGLAAAFAETPIHVLIVRPGFVTTRMTAGMDRKPLATSAEAVSRAAVSGLEAGRDVVWAPRLLRAVMAILRHLPTPVFRRLPL